MSYHEIIFCLIVTVIIFLVPKMRILGDKLGGNIEKLEKKLKK